MLLRNKRRTPRGQAIVLMALTMVGLMVFTGLAIDGGRFYQVRRQAQNAADMASLAGLHAASLSTATNTTVLAAIQTSATQNGITNLGSNLTANYLNPDGTVLKAISAADVAAVPSPAVTVKVSVQIPYPTFFGTFFGRAALTAAADGIASIAVNTKDLSDPSYKYAMYAMAGNDCNTSSTPAMSWNANGLGVKNDNGTGQTPTVYINGASVCSKGNSTSIDGPIVNNGPDGISGCIKFDNKFKPAPTTYILSPNTVPASEIPPPPALTNFRDPYNSSQLMNASSFEPAHYDKSVSSIDSDPTHGANGKWAAAIPGAVHPGSWIRYLQENQSAYGIDISTFVTYIYDTNGSNTVINNIKAAYSAGRRGIYYVDVIDKTSRIELSDAPDDGVSYILTSRMKISSNMGGNSGFTPIGRNGDLSLDPAKVLQNAAALNISFLVGGYPSVNTAANRCGEAPADQAALWFDGNQFFWKGILYVPNGLVLQTGNTNQGHFHGPLVAHSVRTESNNLLMGFYDGAFPRIEVTREGTLKQ